MTIISLTAPEALTEYFESDIASNQPNSCPECNHKLWKHGKRVRVCETLQMCFRLEIPRFICASCRKTLSKLPDFLEAGKRFTRAVREKYLVEFYKNEITYRELAWEDDDREDASASVSRAFRAVENGLERIGEHVLALHEQTVETGLAFASKTVSFQSPASTERTSNQLKVRKLELLRYLFNSLNRYFGSDERAICGAYRSLCLGFRLPTPHWMQHTPF